jgi:uncharacterized protein YjbI with pentapeptide repeats
MHGAEVFRANLSFASGRDIGMAGTNFREATLVDAELHSEEGFMVTFTGAILDRAVLSGSFGYGNFEGVSARGASFRGADLTMTVFTDANLDSADLTGVAFSGAIIANAKLNGTNFSNVVFQNVYLKDADLSRAIVTGADFSEVAQCYPWEKKNPPGC